MRKFDSGATRDADANKVDFDGHLSPQVLDAYASYMHQKRKLPDGSMRDPDNWKLGIPKEAYMKSAWRHFMDVWKGHHGLKTQDPLTIALCALLFNIMGYLHEHLLEIAEDGAPDD